MNRMLRAVGALLICITPQTFAQNLNGSGSTFPAPIYAKWFADFRKTNPGIKVNYQAIGSGAGIQKITDGSVDFAATDDPMTRTGTWPASIHSMG